MPNTKIDLRQVETRVLQDQLDSASTTEMDSVLASVNSELTPSCRLLATSTPNLVVNVGPGTISNPNTSKNRTLSPIQNIVVNFAGGTITLPSTSGTITVSPGTNGSITIGASQFAAVLIQLDSTGNMHVAVGTSVGSLGAVVVPGGNASYFSIGYVIVQTNGSSNIQPIANSAMYQFSGGGSGSSSVPNFTFQNSNYSILTSDDTVQGSSFSGAITLTLPLIASVSAGKTYILEKSDSSSNFVTIAVQAPAKLFYPGSGGGVSSLVLNEQGQCVTIESDGFNWFIVSQSQLTRYLTASGSHTFTVSGVYGAAGCTITTPNIPNSVWKLDVNMELHEGGVVSEFQRGDIILAITDGANNATPPTVISTIFGQPSVSNGWLTSNTITPAPDFMNVCLNTVLVGPNITIYAVPFADLQNPQAAATCNIDMIAVRIQ